MEQPTWSWICFDFCVRCTPNFNENIYVIILEQEQMIQLIKLS